MHQLMKPYAQRYFNLLPHCQDSTDWIGGQTSYSGNQLVDVDIATNKRGTKGYTPTNKRGSEPVYWEWGRKLALAYSLLNKFQIMFCVDCLELVSLKISSKGLTLRYYHYIILLSHSWSKIPLDLL